MKALEKYQETVAKLRPLLKLRETPRPSGQRAEILNLRLELCYWANKLAKSAQGELEAASEVEFDKD